MKIACIITVAAFTLSAATARGAVTAGSGYIYSAQKLANFTQGCVAAGPGGTFVGIGLGFTANAQSVVLAKESGELRLVAMGFSSIADCAYDRATDVLYVTDNADNADLGISTSVAGNTGAQTGDTIFAVPHASRATGLNATGLALLPPDTFENSANVALDGRGGLFISNAGGGTAGSVTRVTGAIARPFANGLAFTGGVAVDPETGDVFVGENLGLPNFDNQIRRYTADGTPVPPVPFAGPSFAFGSADLLFESAGRLLASGNFGADVVAFDVETGQPEPFASGLTFANGMTVDPFTGRVEILSSTFTGADEDRSLHRFTPIARLVAGGSQPESECVHEFYGLAFDARAAACTDGAPCDADGQVNDTCLFPVGFCFNVADPDFPACSASEDVTAVRVGTAPYSAAVTTAAAAVTSALPLRGPTCTFSDGYAVPIRIAKRGKHNGQAVLTVESQTSGGRRDIDVIKLICRPAA